MVVPKGLVNKCAGELTFLTFSPFLDARCTHGYAEGRCVYEGGR